jgi:hypothetical protein
MKLGKNLITDKEKHKLAGLKLGKTLAILRYGFEMVLLGLDVGQPTLQHHETT